MPTPTIPAGNLFMNATLYTGNGSTQTITNGVAGQSFQPDFVWSKNRSNARSHALVNSVVGATSQLQSNTTAVQFTGGFASLDSNGFSVNNNYNENNISETYVAWQWKGGGTATTIAVGSVSSGVPSVASSVSANTTSGFSVATFTIPASGAFTIGHGLGAIPSFVVFKTRSGTTSNWITQHTSTGTQYMLLNSTALATTDSTIWNSAPTASVVSFGTAFASSYPSTPALIYCWTPIAGYSAMGSYTGNGAVDGPFIYLGFRPRFILTKCSSNSTASTVWTIFDTARSPYNAAVLELYPNDIISQQTDTNGMDILSNGFKPKRNSDYLNSSGWTYTYMAFAENPFKYANAR